jgi:hypothetical protein
MLCAVLAPRTNDACRFRWCEKIARLMKALPRGRGPRQGNRRVSHPYRHGEGLGPGQKWKSATPYSAPNYRRFGVIDSRPVWSRAHPQCRQRLVSEAGRISDRAKVLEKPSVDLAPALYAPNRGSSRRTANERSGYEGPNDGYERHTPIRGNPAPAIGPGTPTGSEW